MQNSAQKIARGKVCKDCDRFFRNLYEYPLAIFWAEFFNNGNTRPKYQTESLKKIRRTGRYGNFYLNRKLHNRTLCELAFSSEKVFSLYPRWRITSDFFVWSP